MQDKSLTIEIFKQILGEGNVAYVLAKYNRDIKYRQQHKLEIIATKSSAEKNKIMNALHEYDEE